MSNYKRTITKIIIGRHDINLADFSPLDWDNLLLLAQAEGVAPLVYWSLSKSGMFSSIPEPVRNALRLYYSSTLSQNHKRFKELEILARLFDQADIPVVVLKGGCYALTIYPDIGLRPMGDLDLLVPGAKLTLAARIARQLGYIDAEPDASPGLNDLLSHHVCLQKNDASSVILELHDSLVAKKSYTYAVPMDWFWGQTEPLGTSAQGKYENLLMLTPTAQVLYAAAHAMLQHGGANAPLRWIYDLDLILRSYPVRINWELLLAQARLFEWGSALSAALSQTVVYFDTPIPPQVCASLAELSDRHTSLVESLQTRSATHTLEERQKMQMLRPYPRFRLLLALIAPGPAYMRWRYGLTSSRQLPRYYLLRWAGIIQDGFRTFIHLFAKGNRPTTPDQRPAKPGRTLP